MGSKFFYPNGTQFFVKGISYQLVPEDPLIDTEQCQRDVTSMTELGANAIRVYHVDPSADHRGCMKTLADAGIYLFVDLDTFNTAIEQDSPHWNTTQFEAFRAVLDEFQQFDNTAAVFVGNEVLTTKNGAAAAPYVLAAAHDIKVYRDHMKYRPIPVGYSAADIAELRPMLQNYFACKPNHIDRLDFFALNAYEWCGRSSYIASGYMDLQKNASGYPIPILFSETGCNVARPRTFADQSSVFGGYMNETWSGSIVYEWIQEMNDYGLISYGPRDPNGAAALATNSIVFDGFTRKGTPTPVSPDFYNLKSQWATLSPTGVALSDYIHKTSEITAPVCPESTAGGWSVNPSDTLPVLFGRTPAATAASPTNKGIPSGIYVTANVQQTGVLGSKAPKGKGKSSHSNDAANLIDLSILMSGCVVIITGMVTWWL